MIVVTGAAGFIGSALVHALNQRGEENILIVDRLGEDERWLNLRGLKYREYINADEFFDFLEMEDPDYIEAIYHMGACSSTTQRDMEYLMMNNVRYTKELFSYCADKEIPFCYASSAATYGDGELGYSDEHDQVDALKALNPYGYSKQLVDQAVLNYGLQPPKWFGLKFFNVYGPNEYHKEGMRSMVKQAYEQIQEIGKVKLFQSHHPDFKDGEQSRDFIYVKDVCAAMIGLMERGTEENSGIYNLGTGKARSFNDLVYSVFDSLGVARRIEYIPTPDSLKNQYQYYTQAEMDKFSQVLPDFKFHSLEEGVSDYVKNYLSQKDPFLSL